MMLNIKHEKTDDYILITISGSEHYTESLAPSVFQQLIQLADAHQVRKILLDLRNFNIELSLMDRYEIGKVSEVFKTADKILAVVGGSMLHPARIGENVAQNLGVEMKAFILFEDAVDWLNALS